LLHLVVPLWNQWPMTLAFLESLEAAEPAGSFKLILVDNGSSDATAAGLKAWKKRLPFTLIRNATNRGVAPAWNQGVAAALKDGARWIGILNNDLLLAPGALQRLRRRAEERGWSLACPGTREGALQYDFSAYAQAYMRRCAGLNEDGRWFGWCFLVKAEVFRKIGRFDEGFKLGIGEDEDFFRRAQAARFKVGTSGCAFVHHFGSATIGPLRKLRGKGFEEGNLKILRQRYGIKAPGRRQRWAENLSRTWQRLRWGHLLKE
jgi:GT2 family glycosyltransferase